MALAVAWTPGHVSPAYATHGLEVYPHAFSPAGSGRITTRDGHINCIISFDVIAGGACGYLYASGVSVTIDFAAEADSFVCYSDTGICASGFTETVRTTDALTKITFYGFKKVLWQLSVKLAGAGSGTVTGPGILCGEGCDILLPLLTNVTLTAMAAAGSHFGGWDNEGGCSASQTNVCTYILANDTPIYATFLLDPATPAPTFVPSVPPSIPPASQAGSAAPSIGASSSLPPRAGTTSGPRSTGASDSSTAEPPPVDAYPTGASSLATGAAGPAGPGATDPAAVADVPGAGSSPAALLLVILVIVLAASLVGTWTWLGVRGRRRSTAAD